jgi:hypothetical protein
VQLTLPRQEPKAEATVTVTGPFPTRDDITYQNIVFDGHQTVNQIECYNWKRWRIVGCEFRNFVVLLPNGQPNPDVHSEALYLASGCEDGLIDNTLFQRNGNTSHIFFTWWGGSYADHPKRICVKNSVFRDGYNPWYAIQFRDEIPADAPIYIDPTNTFDGPGSQRPLRNCP